MNSTASSEPNVNTTSETMSGGHARIVPSNATASPEVLAVRQTPIIGSPALAALVAAILVPLVGFVAVWSWALGTFGSASAAAGYLRGDSLLIEPPVFELGKVPFPDKRLLKIELVNLTRLPISVHGFASLCSPKGCIQALDKLPLEIAPRTRRSMTIEYTVDPPRQPETDQPFLFSTEIYTSMGSYPVDFRGVLDGRSPSAIRAAAREE